MENEKELEKIDLTRYAVRFLKVLRWTWLPILILSLLFGGYRYYRSYRVYAPEYQSKAIFAVSSGEAANDIFDNSIYYDSVAAEQIVATFPYLLTTDFMQDLIMAELGTSYIPGSINASSIAESNMFELTVTGSDPQSVYDVLCAVIAAYPKASVYMVDNSQLHVMEEPFIPTEPINSASGTPSLRVLASNTATALMAGLAVTLMLSLLNQSVGSEEELKQMVSLPLVASLPQMRVKKRRKNTEVLLRATDDPGMAEAIRGLRVKVRRQLEEAGGKVVLLTSTIPGEGKTTAAANLAMSLAAEGHATVLLDADLRNQTICRLLGSNRQRPGLMTLLKKPELTVEQCLQNVEGSTLQFISGSSTTRQHYGMDAAAMTRVLNQLKQRFDYIVVDTPPSSIVSDTAMLSRHADCVLYVIRQDYANKAHILDTILGMHQRGLPLTGCILNGTPRSHRQYGYGYGKKNGYGKKYGYGRKSAE